jgi:hypothetical protein
MDILLGIAVAAWLAGFAAIYHLTGHAPPIGQTLTWLAVVCVGFYIKAKGKK